MARGRRRVGRDLHEPRGHRAAQSAGARAHDAEDEMLERAGSRIPDARAVESEIDGPGHDLVRVMVEAASAQQSRGIQHEAASQILKLRAREAGNVDTNPFSACPLLVGFVSDAAHALHYAEP